VRHRWPGNVRELEHAVEHAVFLGRSDSITAADLPATVQGGSGDAVRGTTAEVVETDLAGSLKRSMAHPERRLILEALERSNWRRDAAAQVLGINRTTLYKKLKRLGMNLAELQPGR
jgi:DNA-binding NtrC family response regulator